MRTRGGALDFGLQEQAVGGLFEDEGAAFVETEPIPEGLGEDNPASFVEPKRHANYCDIFHGDAICRFMRSRTELSEEKVYVARRGVTNDFEIFSSP